jgi:hypothetical protein
MTRCRLVFVLTAVFASLGASHRTPNFMVHAPTAQVAQQVGQWAEHYRREKALDWLGQEMPPWPQPCPLHVTLSMDAPGGATSFNFSGGRILSMKMEIQGPLDRLIYSVLPHEVTHTVFAHHFRCPVPRWADEGGSVLSEDDVERDRHDKLVRNILNNGRQMRMRTLFGLKEYPRDVMCLYAQGFSMSDYLVKRSDKRTFLNFVGHGMQTGWDAAAQAFYGHRSVEELEEAWLKHLRDTRRQTDVQVAQNRNQKPSVAGRPVVRLTLPPAEPLDPTPIIRGQAPTQEQLGQRFSDVARPGYLPPTVPAVGQGWQPLGAPGAHNPVPVHLGAPQPLPPGQVPAGFPH